ncbi:MAG: DNA lyase [Candidatus Kapabacteria bacterium]|nr:DNA lyase [Candidatus Kapabacteria bacterium]
MPKHQRFYELCFCLMTPQSSAVHASMVQTELEKMDFLAKGQDVVDVLRAPDKYIRFHHTKHRRLHRAREQWSVLEAVLDDSTISEQERRNSLRELVDGFGMKEASHFLRNIGHRGLAIIDRHLLTNLVTCGVYEEIPSVSTIKRYEDVERSFTAYCVAIGIDMDEIDLLFWCAQTGHILK